MVKVILLRKSTLSFLRVNCKLYNIFGRVNELLKNLSDIESF